MLNACDVSLNVLDKQPLCDFLNKYIPEVLLLGLTTLYNYLLTVRSDLLKWITSAFKNTRLWLCIDETTDCKKHSILYVIVLRDSNGNTITRVVLETLEQFELSTSQVVMFMTGGTAMMLLVGCLLSERDCRLLHVTGKIMFSQRRRIYSGYKKSVLKTSQNVFASFTANVLIFPNHHSKFLLLGKHG
ncbi:hypothetical protein NQ318_001104 [Aromia moschata]|uniref:Uncharacterized protein n=1 Tax=Aromia moschata TaxID=1265417 RepID=A0AAV8ZGL6_9CUCU|nr:hypothetical protein NQ318_001104 [Aromia moschata]